MPARSSSLRDKNGVVIMLSGPDRAVRHSCADGRNRSSLYHLFKAGVVLPVPLPVPFVRALAAPGLEMIPLLPPNRDVPRLLTRLETGYMLTHRQQSPSPGVTYTTLSYVVISVTIFTTLGSETSSRSDRPPPLIDAGG
jgi:hypothetical protein